MKTKLLSVAFFTCAAFCFSSCATLFTPNKQKITFIGESGIGIYDRSGSKKLGIIGQEGTTTIKVRKSLTTTTLFARKEGYAETPLQLETVFNPISILNTFFILGWGVDALTGKICKYEDDVYTIEMRKKE